METDQAESSRQESGGLRHSQGSARSDRPSRGESRGGRGTAPQARWVVEANAIEVPSWAGGGGRERPDHLGVRRRQRLGPACGKRARALAVGLLSGGYGKEELERAGAYRVYQDPADLLHH